MKINLNELTIRKAHDHLVKGDFSAVELADAYLSEIAKKNDDMNAYLEVYSDVKKQAEEADKKIASGKADVLTGIPIALKDNILRKGNIASCASKILANYHATYDSTGVAKLKAEGVVFLGRTNMDEFAMGSSTQNSAYGGVFGRRCSVSCNEWSACISGDRYGRLGTTARKLLWTRRFEAYLWIYLSSWNYCYGFFTRPDWPAYEDSD